MIVFPLSLSPGVAILKNSRPTSRPEENRLEDPPRRILVLEGLSGSGKTTQARRLARHIGNTRSTVVLPEFSHSTAGRTLRDSVLQDPLQSAGGAQEFGWRAVLALADVLEKYRNLRKARSWSVAILDASVVSQVAHIVAASKFLPGRMGSGLRHAGQILLTLAAYLPFPHIMIYLSVPLSVAIQRLERRIRRPLTAGEKVFLAALEAAYEELLMNLNEVKAINATLHPDLIARMVRNEAHLE